MKMQDKNHFTKIMEDVKMSGEPVSSAGAGRGRRRRRAFRSDTTALRYKRGQQKFFAKNYLSVAPDNPYRQAFRQFIGEDAATANAGQKIVRGALGYWGKGPYKEYLKRYVPKGSFSRLGNYLGGLTGIPGMADVGSYAGNKFANYVGFGPYNANQIIGGGNSGQEIMSVNRSDYSGDVCVAKSEFVGNVIARGSAGQPSDFNVVSYSINPGLSQTFPWLSQIAQNFTLYELQGLVFQYKPLFSEDAGISSSLGKVIMATQYDPNSSNFLTSVEMENYDYSNSAKPSIAQHHGVETENNQQALNMQYIRTGATSRDLIFTDIGKFEIATEGIPLAAGVTSVSVGELWVSYKVKLSRAELYGSLLGNNILCDVLQGTWDGAQMTTGTTIVSSFNNIGITVESVGMEQVRVVFPQTVNLGYFQCTFNWRKPADSNGYFLGPTDGINCTFFSPGHHPGFVQNAPNDDALVGSIMITIGIYVNSPGLSQASFIMNLSNNALGIGFGTWWLMVTQISQRLNT